jgi:hypothetical protein
MEVTETCAVFTSNIGIQIDTAEIREILVVLKEVYGENKFGFIANRINQYSVKPLAVINLFSHENLIAGAIVSKTKWGKLNSDYERSFIKEAQTQHFTNLESAIDWVREVVG